MSDTAPIFRISQLMAAMANLAKTGLPTILWIEATLFSLKSFKSGVAIELIDKDATNVSEAPVLKAFLSNRVVAEIEIKIGCAVAMLKGADVRLLIKPSFHARYQLQANVIAIDPSISEGILSQKLIALREKLKADHLYDRQKKMKAPADITNLIIIHPAHSAGWADIEDRLLDFEAKGLLRVHCFTASFEGANSTQEISDALAKAQELACQRRADLVMIIRGGGAASGLAALADAELAEQICCMSVPVVTGTGHAIDQSILDEVAWRAAHTPSLALQTVLKILRHRVGEAWRDWQTIREMTPLYFEQRYVLVLEKMRASNRETIEHIVKRACTNVETTAREIIGRRRALPRERATRHEQINNLIARIKEDCDHLVTMAQTKLKEFGESNTRELSSHLNQDADRISRVREALRESADALLLMQEQSLAFTIGKLSEYLRHAITKSGESLEHLRSVIGSLSLDGTLERGFCIALQDKQLLCTAKSAKAIQRFELLFIDGSILVAIDR